MLQEIERELAKMIAQDIYAAAKANAPALVSALKTDANLEKNGRGLPQPVLAEFASAFSSAMGGASWDGSAEWQSGGSKTQFEFYLTQKITTEIQRVNWATVAQQTDEGNKLVGLLGGATSFNQEINDVVPRLVSAAILASKGKHNGGKDWGWRILTPSGSQNVAHKGMTDFSPCDIFYMSKNSEDRTAREFKQAKKLLLPGWFGKRPPAPSSGPYFK